MKTYSATTRLLAARPRSERMRQTVGATGSSTTTGGTSAADTLWRRVTNEATLEAEAACQLSAAVVERMRATTLQIGEALLSYDAETGSLALSHAKGSAPVGVYATGGVSAYGKGTAEGAGSGGGIDTAAMWEALAAATDEAINASHLAAVTKKLTFTGYTSATYDGTAAVSVAIPNNTNQLANGAGYISRITKAMVEAVLTGSVKSHGHPALTFRGYTSATYSGTAAVSVAIPNNTNQLTNGAGYISGITKAMVEAVLTGRITSHGHVQSLAAVSGTLAIENGGTGAKTALAAQYNLLGVSGEESNSVSDTTMLLCRYITPSASQGYLYARTAKNVWDGYISAKIAAAQSFTLSGRLGGTVSRSGLAYTLNATIRNSAHFTVFSNASGTVGYHLGRWVAGQSHRLHLRVVGKAGWNNTNCGGKYDVYVSANSPVDPMSYGGWVVETGHSGATGSRAATTTEGTKFAMVNDGTGVDIYLLKTSQYSRYDVYVLKSGGTWTTDGARITAAPTGATTFYNKFLPDALNTGTLLPGAAAGGDLGSTSQPYTRLYANGVTAYGDILAKGGVTAYTTSDRRLKTDIRAVRDGAERLMGLGDVSEFRYKDGDGATHIGLMWQDVREKMPAMSHEHDGHGALNYLAPDYINLIAAAAQENTRRIRDLEERTARLERMLSEMGGGGSERLSDAY